MVGSVRPVTEILRKQREQAVVFVGQGGVPCLGCSAVQTCVLVEGLVVKPNTRVAVDTCHPVPEIDVKIRLIGVLDTLILISGVRVPGIWESGVKVGDLHLREGFQDRVHQLLPPERGLVGVSGSVWVLPG